jgi:thiamine monophosphate synthase
MKGFPDIAGIMPNGMFWAIELKTETGKLSKEQTEWIAALNQSGATAVVLRTKDEIADFVACATQIRRLFDQP